MVFDHNANDVVHETDLVISVCLRCLDKSIMPSKSFRCVD